LIFSVTEVALTVSKCSSMLVGALQATGDRGPVSLTIRTPTPAPAGVVEVVDEEAGTVVAAGAESLLLEQEATNTTAPIVAIRARLVRDTSRS
jgi:hypothetical protein